MGFTYFATLIMMMVGTFHAIIGFVGILENEFFVATRNYVFEFDATAWGWIHLIAGLVVIFAGVGLFNGSVWARTVGSQWPLSARSRILHSSPTTRCGQ